MIKQKILHMSNFLYLEDKEYIPVLSDVGYDENLKCEFLDDEDFEKYANIPNEKTTAF